MTSPADYLAAAARVALAGIGTFLFESREQVTVSLNSAPLPAIILYAYTLAQAGPSARVESAAVTLYFGDATPGSNDDAAAAYATQQRMRVLKQRFLAALDANMLAQLDGLKDTGFEAAYEARLDGVGCQFTLTVPAVALC